MPEPYRDGMRIQFAFEDKTYTGFLLGRRYRGEVWYYLPAAMLMKTPLGCWCCGWPARCHLLIVPRLRIAALYLLATPAVLFAVAMTGSRDFGSRYAIFLPMFLAVAAGAVLRRCAGAGAPGRRGAGAVRRGQLTAHVPVLPAVLQRGVRRAGRAPTCGCTTRTSTGGRTWAGSPTGCASAIRASRSGWCTRAPGCRPSTGSPRPTRSRCRPSRGQRPARGVGQLGRQGHRPARRRCCAPAASRSTRSATRSPSTAGRDAGP